MKKSFFLAKILKVIAVSLLSGILLVGCSSAPSIRNTFRKSPKGLRNNIMSAVRSDKIQLNMTQDFDDNTYIVIDKKAYNSLSSNDFYILAKAMIGINESQPACDTLVSKDIYFFDSDRNTILLDYTVNLYAVISKMYKTLDDSAEQYTSEEIISTMEKYREGIGIEFTSEQEEQYNYYHDDNKKYDSYYYSIKMNYEEHQSKLAEEKRAANLKNSDPYIGMSESDINNTAWGRYKDKNETITQYGTYVQYCFSDYRYVYTENGVVTSIQK